MSYLFALAGLPRHSSCRVLAVDTALPNSPLMLGHASHRRIARVAVAALLGCAGMPLYRPYCAARGTAADSTFSRVTKDSKPLFSKTGGSTRSVPYRRTWLPAFPLYCRRTTRRRAERRLCARLESTDLDPRLPQCSARRRALTRAHRASGSDIASSPPPNQRSKERYLGQLRQYAKYLTPVQIRVSHWLPR